MSKTNKKSKSKLITDNHKLEAMSEAVQYLWDNSESDSLILIPNTRCCDTELSSYMNYCPICGNPTNDPRKILIEAFEIYQSELSKKK
jgi:hypothetical protein